MNSSCLFDLDAVSWRLRAGQQLRLLAGEDEAVLYNDQSGETHLLSAIAISLLQQLQGGQADCSQVLARLAAAWEFESDDEAQQIMHTLLTELEALGLIEVCPS